MIGNIVMKEQLAARANILVKRLFHLITPQLLFKQREESSDKHNSPQLTDEGISNPQPTKVLKTTFKLSIAPQRNHLEDKLEESCEKCIAKVSCDLKPKR